MTNNVHAVVCFALFVSSLFLYESAISGALYENSDKVSNLNTSDELYANDGEQGKGVNSTKGYIPKKASRVFNCVKLF